MNDTDPILIKKQLVRDFRILLAVQVIALSVTWLGGNLVVPAIPNYPEWDGIHLLCLLLTLSAMVVFAVAAIWGCYKLVKYFQIKYFKS